MICNSETVHKIVAIVNCSPYCDFEGRSYLTASEYTSLAQWFPLFGNTILLKPRLALSAPPRGWIPLSGDIQVIPVCDYSDGRWQRMASTRLTARKALRGVDLLYARMPNYEGWWTFQIARELGIPLLLELHGCWVSTIMEEDKQSLIRRITRSGRAWHANRAIRQMSNYASAIVTIGPELKKKYAPAGIPTLVSTNHLLPLASYCPRINFSLKDPPLILFVGDIQRRKGLHVLFEALKALKTRGRIFQMVLVGDGLAEAELLADAKKKGIIDRVTFTGRISHGPDLFAWFQRADCLVLPSIASEGVPRVTHEAMALGCPVIATDIGSTAWQLQGNAGIIVQPRDAEALADAICDIIDNDDHRKNLSENGYKRALDYTLEKQQAKLAEFMLANFSWKQLHHNGNVASRD
jgi:glycosyltransferase involved in cell wall biosynthesis